MHPTITQGIKEYGLLVGITIIYKLKPYIFNLLKNKLNSSSSLFHVWEKFIQNKILDGKKKNARKLKKLHKWKPKYILMGGKYRLWGSKKNWMGGNKKCWNCFQKIDHGR